MRLYLDSQTYGVMPIAGGLMDQDPQTLQDFRLIEASIAEVREQGRGT